MRFRRPDHESLEINLIPLIDVLLVMLIFLSATTTFMRQQTLKIALPKATSEASLTRAIEVTVHESGRFAIDGLLVTPPDLTNLTQALRRAVEGQTDPTVVIRAAASATHQLVVTAMQAARQAGIAKVQFATQAGD